MRIYVSVILGQEAFYEFLSLFMKKYPAIRVDLLSPTSSSIWWRIMSMSQFGLVSFRIRPSLPSGSGEASAIS